MHRKAMSFDIYTHVPVCDAPWRITHGDILYFVLYYSHSLPKTVT